VQAPHSAAPAARTGEERPGSDSLALGLLLSALGLGLLRFWRLSEWSLWYDEAATWFDFRSSLASPEIHNALGYRAIGWAVGLCGGEPTEFNLRILPALAGWLVIPLTWWAFRPFAGSRRAAAAALLVSASSWQLYWSQNVRFYTLAQLFAVAGSGLVLRGLWRARILPALAGSVLIAGAGLFHVSASVLLPALVLATWLLSPLALPELKASRRVRVALLLVLLAGLAAGSTWALHAFETFERHEAGASPLHYLLTTGFYVTPLLCAAALVGACVAWKRRSAFGLLAALTVTLGLAALGVASLRVTVAAKFVFAFLPWIAVLATWPLEGEAVEGAEPRPFALGWLAVLVLPALASTALYFGPRAGERPPWRAAYELVWNLREPDDLILGMEAPVGEYYLSALGADLQNPERVAWLDRWRAHRPRDWAAHARRAWYVFNPEQLKGWEDADREDFERFLREQCRLVKCFPLYVESRDLSVWVYVRG